MESNIVDERPKSIKLEALEVETKQTECDRPSDDQFCLRILTDKPMLSSELIEEPNQFDTNAMINCLPISSEQTPLTLSPDTMSTCKILPLTFSSHSSIGLSTASSMSPALSSSSSLSLSVDTSIANTFNLTNSHCIYDQAPNNDCYTSSWYNYNSFYAASDHDSFNHNPNHKQDVSVGTELSISRDLRYKKDFEWLQNFKLPNSYDSHQLQKGNSSHLIALNTESTSKHTQESFKLVEKIQPKKSRTKYSKEQISYLENAYEQSPYPDLILIENLCKTLAISREKINIWFQNRRARNKRCYKGPKTNSCVQNLQANSQMNYLNTNNVGEMFISDNQHSNPAEMSNFFSPNSSFFTQSLSPTLPVFFQIDF